MEIKFDTKTITALIVEAVVLIGMMIGISTCQNQKLDAANQNISALRDSVRTFELKNGDLVAEKQLYILEIEQLEDYIGVTKSEIKELEKKLDAAVDYISIINGEVRVPEVIIKDSIVYIEKDKYTFAFDYKDTWLNFEETGTICGQAISVNVYDINIPIPLTVGLTDDYNIFVKSSNPYVNFTDIQGAVVDGTKLNPKPKRWNIGVQLGIGAQYGLIGKQFDVGPYIGAGISYGFGF